jgi:TolB-like protein
MSHEEGIGKLWSEIGRRNVGRVAVVYAGAAWGLVHMSTVMAEALEIPHWVNRFLVFMLVALAPVVIGFSWVYEITPEGLKRTVEVEKNASLTHRTAQRLNIVIIVLMILLSGLYGADRFLLPHEGAEGGTRVTAEGASKAPVGEGISIAVLPFLNLSGDAQQEFFSDGMTEEITSALAKVKGLQVVGRTSAFEFKGQNKDLRAIGQALNATNLLEGSVRKSGAHVRITAQLIRADNGRHIWTENYDRELTDIFVTQDDIAKAIAGALQVPLGLKTGEILVPSQAIAPESYQQYLQAKALLRANAGGRAKSLTSAVGLLEQVIARDPGYTPAWALLAQTYFLTPQTTPASNGGTVDEARLVVDAWLPKADMAARQAIQLDPTLADGYVGLGAVQVSRGNFLLGEASFSKALALDPNNPDGLRFYSNMLASVGRLKESLAMKLRLHALEPLVPVFIDTAAVVLWLNGQNDAAIAMMKEIPSDRWVNGPAYIYASLGRYNEAANALRESPPENVAPAIVEEAMRLLRTAPAPAPSPQTLPFLGSLSWVYLYVGLPNRALEGGERGVETGYLNPFGQSSLWHPTWAAVRKTERFKIYVRKAGLVEYWRARGWPDVCHPVGKDDFECE